MSTVNIHASTQIEGIQYSSVKLSNNVEDTHIFNTMHNNIQAGSGQITFIANPGFQGSAKISSITDLSEAVLCLRYAAELECHADDDKAAKDKTPRFIHNAFIRSLEECFLKLEDKPIFTNSQYQGLISTSILKHDLPRNYLERYDGYVINKTTKDYHAVTGTTQLEIDMYNFILKNKADAAGVVQNFDFTVAYPLSVLSTFFHKAKIPIRKMELQLKCGTFASMVARGHIYQLKATKDTWIPFAPTTNALKGFKILQGNLLLPTIKLAPMSIVQLNENGDKPFGIAIPYHKFNTNLINLANRANNQALTTCNGRRVEIYIQESTNGNGAASYKTLPYSRLTFDTNGGAFPKMSITSYPDLNRIAHGMKAFLMTPKVKLDKNWLANDSIDNQRNKFKKADYFYPHSFDLALSDINDVIYENPSTENTCAGTLQLNFDSDPEVGKADHTEDGQEVKYNYAAGRIIIREDIVFELKREHGILYPVIHTNTP